MTAYLRNKMDDLAFVQRCVRKDKLAWDEFVDKYSRLIYNHIWNILSAQSARRFCQDKVEEIFQEILFLLVKDNFKKLKSFKGLNGCSLASWLRQVAINCTLDYLRRAKIVVSLDEESEEGSPLKEILADEGPAATEMLLAKERLDHLKSCIKKLTRDDKFFLELHIHRDIDLDSLKDILRISRGAVDMRKMRIIQRLKECFRSKGFALDF